MKKIIYLITSITLVFVACNGGPANTGEAKSTQVANIDTTKMKSGQVFYQCEMHPEVLSDKAGTCSTCGMELEKVIKK